MIFYFLNKEGNPLTDESMLALSKELSQKKNINKNKSFSGKSLNETTTLLKLIKNNIDNNIDWEIIVIERDKAMVLNDSQKTNFFNTIKVKSNGNSAEIASNILKERL